MIAVKWLISGLALASLIGARSNHSQASQVDAPSRDLTCSEGHAGEDCLATFAVDLDGDEKIDQVDMIAFPRLGVYTIIVRTHAGRTLRPFAAAFDRKNQKVSLTPRTGSGDKRCQSWVSGMECGYPLVTHDVPETVLYLSDSKHGSFAMYIPKAYGKDHNKDGHMVVVPALEGSPTEASRIRS